MYWPELVLIGGLRRPYENNSHTNGPQQEAPDKGPAEKMEISEAQGFGLSLTGETRRRSVLIPQISLDFWFTDLSEDSVEVCHFDENALL